MFLLTVFLLFPTFLCEYSSKESLIASNHALLEALKVLTETETQVAKQECNSPPDATCKPCRDTDACDGKKYKVTTYETSGSSFLGTCNYPKNTRPESKCPTEFLPVKEGVSYVSQGFGKCKTIEGKDPAHQYHGNKGLSDCEKECEKGDDCFGFSVSSYGNCLLWLQQDIVGGGDEWGSAKCYVKQPACKGTRMADGVCCSNKKVANDGTCCYYGKIDDEGTCCGTKDNVIDGTCCAASQTVFENYRPKSCCAKGTIVVGDTCCASESTVFKGKLPVACCKEGAVQDDGLCEEMWWDQMMATVDDEKKMAFLEGDLPRVIQEKNCRGKQGTKEQCRAAATALGLGFYEKIDSKTGKVKPVRSSSWPTGCVFSRTKKQLVYNEKTSFVEASADLTQICESD